MARAKIKREFLAVVMECPLYFSAPLQKRLESLNIFSQKSVHYRIWSNSHHLIENAIIQNCGNLVKVWIINIKYL